MALRRSPRALRHCFGAAISWRAVASAALFSTLRSCLAAPTSSLYSPLAAFFFALYSAAACRRASRRSTSGSFGGWIWVTPAAEPWPPAGLAEVAGMAGVAGVAGMPCAAGTAGLAGVAGVAVVCAIAAAQLRPARPAASTLAIRVWRAGCFGSMEYLQGEGRKRRPGGCGATYAAHACLAGHAATRPV
ncbi:membrane hypothetical protein [Cupriavidus taiwanensis]|uniref:Uncharacterized protein n=1 Tax=Cupriavidus taiwanensis TaxID=164546 RepID=A0A975X4E3_9BURK|nr:membrane hypothetical protein [Cupriavidus taiwanensis]